MLVVPQVMHIGANVGEVIIAARYGPSLGEYMMHCHNNVHEDHEMMRAFMVSRTRAVVGRVRIAACSHMLAVMRLLRATVHRCHRICVVTCSQPCPYS